MQWKKRARYWGLNKDGVLGWGMTGAMTGFIKTNDLWKSFFGSPVISGLISNFKKEIWMEVSYIDTMLLP